MVLEYPLLASLPSVAFRTSGSTPDLKMETNNTSLHNEHLLHRACYDVPLYINSKQWNKQLLFKLHVKCDANMVRSVTANDFEIYNIKPSILENKLENDFVAFDELVLIIMIWKNLCLILKIKQSLDLLK